MPGTVIHHSCPRQREASRPSVAVLPLTTRTAIRESPPWRTSPLSATRGCTRSAALVEVGVLTPWSRCPVAAGIVVVLRPGRSHGWVPSVGGAVY